jgi:uncharacterized membrane protein
MTATTSAWRQRMVLTLSIFYCVAGILHLTWPQPFLSITPAWVPHPETVIALTGFCEIAGAVGLWTPRVSRLAAAALALYAFCVFPANIKHALDSLGAGDPSIWELTYHIIRLPLQPVFIWAALFAGDIVTWPFGSRCFDRAPNAR